MPLLEVCVESLAALREAQEGGAGRIELCAHLDQGGLSPPASLIEAALDLAQVPVHVMVRPRAGDFVARESELEAMLDEIQAAKARPIAGLVFGLITPARGIDREATARLVGAARPLPVTFHRAFDQVRDLESGLEDLIALSVQRVLTSGGRESAYEGRAALRSLVLRARGRIRVMAGGGVRAHNAAAIVAASGVEELHASVAFELPG